MKRICKNCFLSATSLNNFFCGLNGKAVKYPESDCQRCITEDDVDAAREEYLNGKYSEVVDDLFQKIEDHFGVSYADLVKPIPNSVPTREKIDLSPNKYPYMKLEINISEESCARWSEELERAAARLEKVKSLQVPEELRRAAQGLFAYYTPGIDHYRFKSGRGSTSSKPAPAKNETFLCENCGKYVLVPAEGVGRKIHWICRACHQENCFEVAQE